MPALSSVRFAAAAMLASALCCATVLLLLCAPAALAQTLANTGLVSNAPSLRVAVILNCNTPLLPVLPYPYPLPPGFDVTKCDMGIGAYSDWMTSYVTFDRVVRESGGIPSGTGYNTPLELVYFQIGAINYINPNQTELGAQYAAAVQNAFVLAQQLGAYGGFNPAGNGGNGSWDAPCPYCPAPTAYVQPGIYGRFPILITPTFADTIPQNAPYPIPQSMSDAFFTGCQLSKQCIAIAQYSGSEDWMTCRAQIEPIDAIGTLAKIIPPVCLKAVDPSLLADKRPNQRKFDFGFTSLPSQNAMLSQMIPFFKLKGAKTAVWFLTANKEYQKKLYDTAMASFRANRISLSFDVVFLNADGTGLTPAQITTYADRTVAADPDLFIFLAHSPNPMEVSTGLAMLRALRARKWSPRAMVLPGGSDAQVVAALNADHPGDGDYIYGATFQSILLRTANYDAQAGTAEVPNWEPFPSTGDKLSPQVFFDQYLKDWGNLTGTSTKIQDGYILPQVITGLLVIVAKLFYLAGTDDARLMQAASVSMSIPSMAGLLQFDAFGRTASNEQFVMQHQGGANLMITPLDIGSPDIYPLPTWAERIPPTEGSASFQGTSAEKAGVAVTIVVEVYLALLLALVLVFRASPIIKSSSPFFCALMLLGAMACVSSNFGLSLYAVEAGCAADAWMLTTGFTLMMSALFAKVWRVYKIFHSGKLNVVKISNRDLLLLVGAFVGVDLVVNIIWQATSGFPTRYVSVDQYRPVYDYVVCNYSDSSKGFIWAHLVFKGGLLLAGMVLTVLARNLPSMFNETPYLAASMYNAALLLAFCIPLVASGVGGRETTYLIRVYGLLAIVVSTASILFLPKLYGLRKPDAVSGAGARTIQNTSKADTVGRTQPSRHRTGDDGSVLSDAGSDDAGQQATAPALKSHASSGKRTAFGATATANAVELKYLPPRSPTNNSNGDVSPVSPDATATETQLRQQLAAAQAELAELRRRVPQHQSNLSAEIAQPSSAILPGGVNSEDVEDM